jgi:hypothetical protein
MVFYIVLGSRGKRLLPPGSPGGREAAAVPGPAELTPPRLDRTVSAGKWIAQQIRVATAEKSVFRRTAGARAEVSLLYDAKPDGVSGERGVGFFRRYGTSYHAAVAVSSDDEIPREPAAIGGNDLGRLDTLTDAFDRRARTDVDQRMRSRGAQ